MIKTLGLTHEPIIVSKTLLVTFAIYSHCLSDTGKYYNQTSNTNTLSHQWPLSAHVQTGIYDLIGLIVFILRGMYLDLNNITLVRITHIYTFLTDITRVFHSDCKLGGSEVYLSNTFVSLYFSGVAALILAASPSMSPSSVYSSILSSATSGKVTDSGRRSPNLLLFTN